jgi:CO/xanthine dehydrogenase Mo-binding subunit
MSPQSIGASLPRVGGEGRVTGALQYLADIKMADALHVKLVTLDCARARIISIDKTAAEALAGVHLVMTPDDLPKPMPRFGPFVNDRPVLAVGEVNYHGEAVAAVAAETEEIAAEAARLVRVEQKCSPVECSVWTTP